MLTWRQTLFGKISIELNNDEDDEDFVYMCVKSSLGINLWKVTMEIVDSSTILMFQRICSGEERVQKDYFAQMHVYDEKLFHRQYEMHMSFFIHIMELVAQQDCYFV